jgi:hypothetical protein
MRKSDNILSPDEAGLQTAVISEAVENLDRGLFPTTSKAYGPFG